MLDPVGTRDKSPISSDAGESVSPVVLSEVDLEKFAEIKAEFQKQTPAELGLPPADILLCAVRRSGTPIGIEVPLHGPAKVLEGSNWIDPKGTAWKATFENGNGEIVDANGKKTSIFRMTEHGEIAEARITDKSGKEIASISVGAEGGKTYTYRTVDGDVVTTELERAIVRADGGIHLKSVDGRTFERRTDGSYIERDRDYRPIEVKDANGNCYSYLWNGGKSPAEVRVFGPATANQELRYTRCSPSSRQPAEYKVFVGAEDKPSTWLLGASIGGGGDLPGSVGVSLPLQERANVAVVDGKLVVRQNAKTADAFGSVVTYEFNLDGTTNQTRSSRWSSQWESFQYTRKGVPPSTLRRPQ